MSSEVLSMNSEKLNLSRKQFFRRRKKTLAALGSIHTCSGATKKLPQDNKPLLEGLWTTLISTASKHQMTSYIRNSNICMQEIIPSIVKGKIKYEQSGGNQQSVVARNVNSELKQNKCIYTYLQFSVLQLLITLKIQF